MGGAASTDGSMTLNLNVKDVNGNLHPMSFTYEFDLGNMTMEELAEYMMEKNHIKQALSKFYNRNIESIVDLANIPVAHGKKTVRLGRLFKKKALDILGDEVEKTLNLVDAVAPPGDDDDYLYCETDTPYRR